MMRNLKFIIASFNIANKLAKFICLKNNICTISYLIAEISHSFILFNVVVLCKTFNKIVNLYYKSKMHAIFNINTI